MALENTPGPGVSNKQIYDLLISIQINQKQLEQQLKDLELRLDWIGHESKKDLSTGDTSILIGAIDQGTSSSRFLIFNLRGEIVASHQKEFKQIHPNPGWHEHDPLELVSSVYECIDKAVQNLEKTGISKWNIKAVGITNQRETTVVWDTETGEPLHNAIVWSDTRSAVLVRDLKSKPGSEKLQELCGLPLSTYPSCAKISWMLQNEPKVANAYSKGRLAFGTVDSWLTYKLNGGPAKNVHVSDSTNASRTMFMNLRTLKYDDELLQFFGIDKQKIRLPKIVKSSDAKAYGEIHAGPLSGVPITGCLGDQSAALVGQKGFEPGRAKNTYGTGCFLLYNVGQKPVISKHGLLATVAYDFGEPVYALEGSIAVAGSAIKFLINNLEIAQSSDDISKLAESVEDNGGLVFVTAFSGLFAPYWIADVKGTLFGITQHTEKGHIARATLEAVCFQTKAVLDAMEKDSGQTLQRLAVDGGLSNSDLCMQIQSDLICLPVDRPKMRETTALGAAIASGLAAGVWRDLGDLQDINSCGGNTFEPKIQKGTSKTLFGRWEEAVKKCTGFV